MVAEQAFTYKAEGDITSVSPSSGQSNTVVQINGTNLFGHGGSVSVSLAGVPVKSTSLATTTQIVVVANASDAQTGDVLIVADTGATVTESDGWKQLEEGVVTAVEPSSGHGSTEVAILGARLLAGASHGPCFGYTRRRCS